MCFTVQLSRSLSCDSHIRLSHLFWLVKNFFHFLENFFFQEFLKFLESTALADSYVRIPQHFPFVNSFREIFLIFLKFSWKAEKKEDSLQFSLHESSSFPGFILFFYVVINRSLPDFLYILQIFLL